MICLMAQCSFAEQGMTSGRRLDVLRCLGPSDWVGDSAVAQFGDRSSVRSWMMRQTAQQRAAAVAPAL